jgi:hypothetical protein
MATNGNNDDSGSDSGDDDVDNGSGIGDTTTATTMMVIAAILACRMPLNRMGWGGVYGGGSAPLRLMAP